MASPDLPEEFSITEAMREPHSSRKKPGDSEPKAASDMADDATIKSDPNVTHTDAERVRAAFSTPFSGETEKKAFTQSNTSESSMR